jgi:hypothetical protein
VVIKRSKPPREWKDYGRYKPYLRRDFSYTCAYSWVHESWLGGEPEFEVEHFRPKGKREFAHLQFDYANLYYVWGPCNRLKGGAWPSPEEEAAGFRFVDPCAEVAFEYFAYELRNGYFTGQLIGHTPAGCYTVEKCGLNNRALCDKRREQAKRFLELRNGLRRIDKVFQSETLSTEGRRALEQERQGISEQLVSILCPKPSPLDDPDVDAGVADGGGEKDGGG